MNISIEKVFSAVDLDNDGKLSLDEMYKVFHSLGVFCDVRWSVVKSVLLATTMAEDGNNDLGSLSTFTRWARQDDKTPTMGQERTVTDLRQAILRAERDRGISVEKVRIELLLLL